MYRLNTSQSTGDVFVVSASDFSAWFSGPFGKNYVVLNEQPLPNTDIDCNDCIDA